MPDKPDKTKKPLSLPLHEALPDMITDAAIRDDVAGFRRLLKIVEQVKIPDNHAKIIKAIHEGWEIIKDDLEFQVMVAKTTMDMAIYERDMNQDAADEVDFARDEERREQEKQQQEEAELEKIETEKFDFPPEPVTEATPCPHKIVDGSKFGPAFTAKSAEQETPETPTPTAKLGPTFPSFDDTSGMSDAP